MEKIYVQNTRARYEVCIEKLDHDDDSIKLGGAIFSLYIYHPQEHHYELLEAGLTTDAQGILTIDELLPGSYRLLETKAPEGYYLPEDCVIDFVVNIDGSIDIEEDGVIKIYNKLLGKIQICKVDSEDHDLFLAGAEFILYKYNEDEGFYEVYESGLVSGEDGCLLIEELEPGDYKLVETKSPAGYLLPEDPETFFTIVL